MPGRPNDVPTVVYHIKRVARIRRATVSLFGRPQALPRRFLYLPRWFLIDDGKFLRDSPNFVFIFAFQGGVLHPCLQSLLSLVFQLVKTILCRILSSRFHDVFHGMRSNGVTTDREHDVERNLQYK